MTALKQWAEILVVWGLLAGAACGVWWLVHVVADKVEDWYGD